MTAAAGTARKPELVCPAGSLRALVAEGDAEYGLLPKNTLDAIGPLVPEFLRRA